MSKKDFGRKIACSTWSFNQGFNEKRLKDVEFIKKAKDWLGVDGVELLYAHITSELEDIRKASEESNTPVICLATHSELITSNRSIIEEQIDHVVSRIRDAETLDASYVRINAGTSRWMRKFAVPTFTDAAKEILRRTKDSKIILVLENQGGMTSDPENLLEIMNNVRSPRLKICFDFGNFANEDIVDALRMLLDHIEYVHAKYYGMDPDGKPSYISEYERILGILEHNKYDKWFSIEYEQGILSESRDQESSAESIRELVKYIAEKSKR